MCAERTEKIVGLVVCDFRSATEERGKETVNKTVEINEFVVVIILYING